ISAYVGVNRKTIKSIIIKLKTSDSPLPLKGVGGPKKFDERAERQMERLIREGLFIPYNLLLFHLQKVSIKVSQVAIIVYIQSIGSGSYYVAHKSQ
ncbi:hypothetical protein K501DRAFT_125156, partial [Backusella circina FSU 941]